MVPSSSLSPSAPLPPRKRVPLVETVVGVQFEEVSELNVAEQVRFWRSVESSYPRLRQAVPIDRTSELFGDDVKLVPSNRLLFRTGLPGRVRLQLSSENDQQMLQLQNDRLHFNWRGTGDSYGCFSENLGAFLVAYRELVGLVASLNTSLTPDHWEVTYVNHLPRGVDWNEPSDWSRILPGLFGPGVVSPRRCKLDGVHLKSSYTIDGTFGRLHLEAQQAYVGEDKASGEILFLQLVARGRVHADAQDPDSIRQSLVSGHDALVDAFWSLPSEAIKEKWGK